jgi:MYXO-CTERM domain-containing protein
MTFALPAGAVASAELYRTQAKFYGRFEARLRFPPGDGVVGSFFLWKAGSETTGAFWNELDFEKVGASCELRTNALFGAPSVGHSQTAAAGNWCAEYHTYGFEWAPTYISWQIDGTEVRRDTGATATAFAQNASAGMEMHFNIWPGDATFGGNFNPSILPVHQYVSWVQYSAYNNGNFSLDWREDFNAASVPSGWAVGNWASPKGKSTHSPADVNFVNGISILSLTNDNATGFTGMPPGDGAAGGSGAGGSGGSSTGGASGSSTGGTSGSAAGGTSGSAAGGASGSATGGMDGGSSGAGTSAGGGGAEPAGGSMSTGGQGGGYAGTSAGGSGYAGAAAGTGQLGGAGAAVGGAPAAGSGAAQGEAPPHSAGCGCRLATTPRSSTALGALTLATVMVLAARRRSRRLPRS